MIRNIIRMSTYLLSNSKKIPRPRDPAIPQTFQTKLTDDQVKILIDPRGFMTEEEKSKEQQNIQQANANLKAKESSQSPRVEKKNMQPEYGFKPKGPQPTRYGDWQVRGKCVDF